MKEKNEPAINHSLPFSTVQTACAFVVGVFKSISQIWFHCFAMCCRFDYVFKIREHEETRLKLSKQQETVITHTLCHRLLMTNFKASHEKLKRRALLFIVASFSVFDLLWLLFCFPHFVSVFLLFSTQNFILIIFLILKKPTPAGYVPLDSGFQTKNPGKNLCSSINTTIGM